MVIPGLGPVTKDTRFGWYTSEEIAVPMFGGEQCRIHVDGYDRDSDQGEFHVAIANFLSAPQSVLRDAEADLFRYYKDCEQFWVAEGNAPIQLPADVWRHIRIGDEPHVSRRHYGDKAVYVSVGCGCDWEDEHGLQIVFKKGLKVNKLGPFDGHLTNSDAYADDSLENVVYR